MTPIRAQLARASGAHRLVVGAVAMLLVFVSAVGSNADDIVRVEEDWQLVLRDPDAMTVSPQATCTISPLGNLGSHYAVLDMNLRNFPSYQAGGIQLQLWNGESPVAAVKSHTGIVLQSGGETISWTQSATLSDGNLTFAVINCNSETWGNFGDGNSIAVVGSTDLENLNDYNPAVSVANSGIGYGANRVVSLTLVGIRVYSTTGLVGQDTTPRVVYPAP